jgi:hypothetical protein
MEKIPSPLRPVRLMVRTMLTLRRGQAISKRMRIITKTMYMASPKASIPLPHPKIINLEVKTFLMVSYFIRFQNKI